MYMYMLHLFVLYYNIGYDIYHERTTYINVDIFTPQFLFHNKFNSNKFKKKQ